MNQGIEKRRQTARKHLAKIRQLVVQKHSPFERQSEEEVIRIFVE